LKKAFVQGLMVTEIDFFLPSLLFWFLLLRPDAISEEFDPKTQEPVIVFMPEISKTHLGGTMRLGLRPTIFREGTESWSNIRKLYGGEKIIWERHRHRYEVGPSYVERFEQSGLNFIGRDEKGERMQVFELKGEPPSTTMRNLSVYWIPLMSWPFLDHPYYVGLQAHPEFCTRPLNPSPPFLGFVAASCGGSILDEQLELQKGYVSPHPEVAKVLQTAEPVSPKTIKANGIWQANGISVEAPNPLR
jgi:CTP synthase